jgi:hypothetical protein
MNISNEETNTSACIENQSQHYVKNRLFLKMFSIWITKSITTNNYFKAKKGGPSNIRIITSLFWNTLLHIYTCWESNSSIEYIILSFESYKLPPPHYVPSPPTHTRSGTTNDICCEYGRLPYPHIMGFGTNIISSPWTLVPN